MLELRPAVIAVIAQIPRGRVCSYGQLAGWVFSPRQARAVGRILAELSPAEAAALPWHRVIGASGKISGAGPRAARQRALLQAEGVEFSGAGRVSWARFGWDGPED